MRSIQVRWTPEEWAAVHANFVIVRQAEPDLARDKTSRKAQLCLPEGRQKTLNGGSAWTLFDKLTEMSGAQEAAAIVANHPPKVARIVVEPTLTPAAAKVSSDLMKRMEVKSNLTDLLAQVKQVEKAIQEKVAEDNAEVQTLKKSNSVLTMEIDRAMQVVNTLSDHNDRLKAKIAELQGPGSLTALVEAMKAELLASQAIQTMALIRYFETGERPDGTSLVKGSEGGQATQVPAKVLEAAKSPETALLEALRSPSQEAQKKHDPSPTPSPVAKIRRKVLICGVPESQLQYFRTNLPEINFQAFDPNKPHFKDGPVDADLCILVRNGVVSHSASNAFITKYGKGKVIQVRKGQGRIMEVVKNHMSLA